MDEEYVLMAHITSHGYYDGFQVGLLDNIFNIEVETNYNEKIMKLYQGRKESHPVLTLKKERSLLEEALEWAKAEEKYVLFEMVEDDDYPPIGLVKEISEDYICVQCYDGYGEKDGFAYLKRENIVRACIDGKEGQDLEILCREKE